MFQKNSGIKKGSRQERGYHNFPSEIFFLRGPRNIVRDSFCVDGNFCYPESLWLRGGKVGEGWSRTTSRRTYVVSQDREFS